jgi:hypothetical protein
MAVRTVDLRTSRIMTRYSGVKLSVLVKTHRQLLSQRLLPVNRSTISEDVFQSLYHGEYQFQRWPFAIVLRVIRTVFFLLYVLRALSCSLGVSLDIATNARVSLLPSRVTSGSC